MKKTGWAAITLLVLSAILTVISWIFLPDVVVTQVSVGGSGTTQLPKLLAVALPAVLGMGGAAAGLLSKGGDGKNKPLLISAVGVFVFGIMLAVNL